jgi:hypothetical protein
MENPYVVADARKGAPSTGRGGAPSHSGGTKRVTFDPMDPALMMPVGKGKGALSVEDDDDFVRGKAGAGKGPISVEEVREDMVHLATRSMYPRCRNRAKGAD